MDEFDDLDVPNILDFGRADEIDIEDGYFERHAASPSCFPAVRRTSEHNDDVKKEDKSKEEKEPCSSSRRQSVRVKYQYKFKKATVPKTPNLTCRNRRRLLTVDTPNTREGKELQLMKEQQFKATRLERRVFDEPVKPKLEHKHTVHSEEPRLATKSRAALRGERHHEAETEGKENIQFKANPLPNYEELRAVGLYKCQSHGATIPKSPEFSCRAKPIKAASDGNSKMKTRSYYHPPPKFPSPFRPQHPHKTTKVEAFSFEGRVLRNKYVYNQESSGAESASESVSFKAKPVPKVDPFQPRHGLIPPTKPRESLVPHALSSRLPKRQQFDEEFAHRWEHLEKMRDLRLSEKEKREKKVIRSKTAFHAQSVKRYKPVALELPHKATKAKSPKFSERLNCVDKRKLAALKEK